MSRLILFGMIVVVVLSLALLAVTLLAAAGSARAGRAAASGGILPRAAYALLLAVMLGTATGWLGAD